MIFQKCAKIFKFSSGAKASPRAPQAPQAPAPSEALQRAKDQRRHKNDSDGFFPSEIGFLNCFDTSLKLFQHFHFLDGFVRRRMRS